jgi:hypothetical protein
MSGEHGTQAKYACHTETLAGGEAKSIDIEALHIRGRHAGGRIAVSGGDGDGMTLTITFVKRDGWRFDRLVRASFDRPRVNRAILAEFARRTTGFDKMKDCVTAAVTALPDEALEHSMVDSSPGAIVRPLLECSMRAALDKEHVPKDFADCLVAHILGALTDEQMLKAISSNDQAWLEGIGRRAGVTCRTAAPPAT